MTFRTFFLLLSVSFGLVVGMPQGVTSPAKQSRRKATQERSLQEAETERRELLAAYVKLNVPRPSLQPNSPTGNNSQAASQSQNKSQNKNQAGKSQTESASFLYVPRGTYTTPWEENVERTTGEASSYEVAALFQLAKRAAEVGQTSLAIQWVTEVLRHKPEHAAARHILGYKLYENEWCRPVAKKMLEAGKKWHPRYGWIRLEDLSKYEKDLRLRGKVWVTSEADRKRRQRIKSGWQIKTDHFRVITNKSLTEGTELAAKLEQLYEVWFQLYPEFVLSKKQIQQLFLGKKVVRKKLRPFEVFYYRNKAEYIATLRRQQPRVAMTIGIYFDTSGASHFFAGKDSTEATLFHESVHQLFQESRSRKKKVAEHANFWALEAVATYFESLQTVRQETQGAWYSIGGAKAGRMPDAMIRGLDPAQRYFLPFEQMAALSKNELQHRTDLAPLYTQMAGVGTFMMQAKAGKYREPWRRYLRKIYDRQDSPEEFSRQFSQEARTLEKAYFEYLMRLSGE